MRRIRCPRCKYVNTVPAAYAERSFGCESCTAKLTVNRHVPAAEPVTPPPDFSDFIEPLPPLYYVPSNDPLDFDEPSQLPESPPPISYRPPPRRRPGMGMGIASVSLGVVAICFTVTGCGFPLLGLVALPCAILAIIFGYHGLGSEGGGMAAAGMILGKLAIVIPVLLVVLYLALGVVVFSLSQLR